MKFTSNQLAAIQSNESNLRIIACAGSGKTSTIAAKVAFLLNPQNKLGVAPKNIIAFTYTERAAAELKNKIITFIKDSADLKDISGLADMYIGTIHGWCLKALQENEFQYQKFSVLDEIKLKLFVDKNYKNIGMKDITKVDNDEVSMKIFTDTGRFIQLMNVVRESTHNRKLPENIEMALYKYKQTLYEHRYFDFTMILTEALLKLKEKGKLYEKIKSDLKFLIVDEYQDINPIQEDLIFELYSASDSIITVVGDDDQNIYQWRGSNNEFIKGFLKKYKPAKEIVLKENFRSSKGIISLAETLIAKNDRLPKEMISAEVQHFVKKEDVLFNEFDTIEEENDYIANLIVQLYGIPFKDETNSPERGLDYSDFAILLRTWSKTQEIVNTLDRFNIPYITAGVNQLFEVNEVKAALGIYYYLDDQITFDELSGLWLSIQKNKIDKKKLAHAIIQLEKYKPNNFKDGKGKLIWAYSLQKIYWDFIESAEITEESFNNTSKEIIMYNLGKFSQVINDFEEINFNSSPPSFHLFSFLNFIKYAAIDYYPEGWISNPYKTIKAVQIMTIHQAKGLEFPVVFIPGLNKNYLPAKKPGGLTAWHFLDSNVIKNYDRYMGTLEDERRLFYVAITRAQKYLFISRAPDLNNQLYRKASIFVDEISVAESLVSNHPDFSKKRKATPKPKETAVTITLNFSVLKDFFECSYRFKLVSMYGFSYPLDQRMGFGKSLHNGLMEIHKRSMSGEVLTENEILTIALSQSHFPYLAKSTKLNTMKDIVKDTVVDYYKKNKNYLSSIQFVEQDIQLNLDEGILVTGTIDLIRKKTYEGKYETTIIEFKSSEEAQKSKVTYDQLCLYALGHKELTGETADYIQIYDLEKNVPSPQKVLNPDDMINIQRKIQDAATLIKDQHFKKIDKKQICKDCLQYQLCFYGLKHNKKR